MNNKIKIIIGSLLIIVVIGTIWIKSLNKEENVNLKKLKERILI